MKKERRWLKSAIAASTGKLPAMPWQRGQRHRPASQNVAPPRTAAVSG